MSTVVPARPTHLVAASVGTRHRRRPLAAVAVVAVSLTLLLQAFRVLLPLEWTTSSDVGLVVAAATFPLLFLAPLLAPLFVRAGRRGVWAAVLVLCVGRLVLQAAVPAPFWLAAVVTGAGLAAVVAVFVAEAARRDGPAAVVVGAIVGFALDVALRGAFGTWDAAWRTGVWAWVVALALPATLLAAAAFAEPAAMAPPALRRGAGRAAAVMGLLLAPEVLFLQSPAYLASAGGLSLGWAVAVVVAAGAVALVAAVAALRSPSQSLALVAAVALGAVVWASPGTTDVGAVVALVTVGQVAAAVIAAVAVSATSSQRTTAARVAAGSTAGLLFSYLVLLLYQLHYEHPLPLGNRWLLMVGVAVIAVVLLPARAVTRRAELDLGRTAVGLAAAIVVVAGAVGLAVQATAAKSPTATTADWPLRVMSYNISGGVGTDGRIDLAAVAQRIRSSGADVVALQEVYRGWPLAGTVDAAGWLQHELGWHQVWAPAADRQAGNLLLSRVPLTDRQVMSLPRGGGSMDRSAAMAMIDVAGEPVLVVDTHLQHRNTAASMNARQTEIRALLRAIGGNGNVVLMGDLNPRNPDLVDLRTLTDHGLTTALNGSTCTSPTSNDNCSDYVYVGRGLTPLTTAVVPRSPFDHRPVVAEIARASRT